MKKKMDYILPAIRAVEISNKRAICGSNFNLHAGPIDVDEYDDYNDELYF